MSRHQTISDDDLNLQPFSISEMVNNDESEFEAETLCLDDNFDDDELFELFETLGESQKLSDCLTQGQLNTPQITSMANNTFPRHGQQISQSCETLSLQSNSQYLSSFYEVENDRLDKGGCNDAFNYLTLSMHMTELSRAEIQRLESMTKVENNSDGCFHQSIPQCGASSNLEWASYVDRHKYHINQQNQSYHMNQQTTRKSTSPQVMSLLNLPDLLNGKRESLTIALEESRRQLRQYMKNMNKYL